MPVVSAISVAAGTAALLPCDVPALRTAAAATGESGNAVGASRAKFEFRVGTVGTGLDHDRLVQRLGPAVHPQRDGQRRGGEQRRQQFGHQSAQQLRPDAVGSHVHFLAGLSVVPQSGLLRRARRPQPAALPGHAEHCRQVSRR